MILRLGLNAAAHLAAGVAFGAMTVITVAFLVEKGREAQREMGDRPQPEPPLSGSSGSGLGGSGSAMPEPPLPESPLSSGPTPESTGLMPGPA